MLRLTYYSAVSANTSIVPAAMSRVASLYPQLPAGNPAFAEAATISSAGAKPKNGDNAGLPGQGEMVQRVRLAIPNAVTDQDEKKLKEQKKCFRNL